MSDILGLNFSAMADTGTGNYGRCTGTSLGTSLGTILANHLYIIAVDLLYNIISNNLLSHSLSVVTVN